MYWLERFGENTAESTKASVYFVSLVVNHCNLLERASVKGNAFYQVEELTFKVTVKQAKNGKRTLGKLGQGGSRMI